MGDTSLPPELEPAALVKEAMYGMAARYRRIVRKRRPFWSYVGDVFMHGSGYSALICRRHGYDPDSGEPLKEAAK